MGRLGAHGEIRVSPTPRARLRPALIQKIYLEQTLSLGWVPAMSEQVDSLTADQQTISERFGMLVTPYPGANRDDMLRTLRDIKAAAQNASNARGPGAEPSGFLSRMGNAVCSDA